VTIRDAKHFRKKGGPKMRKVLTRAFISLLKKREKKKLKIKKEEKKRNAGIVQGNGP